jgi:phage terminase large subunit
MPDFDFSEIYSEVFFTKRPYIHLWGGRGRGGSHFVTDYFLCKITQPQYFRGYFMREVFGDIKDSLFRDFADRLEDNETIDSNRFTINDSTKFILDNVTKNTISSKGFKKSSGNRTAKLKSLAGATHIIIEEAEEIGEEDKDKLVDSVRTIKSDIQIISVFNPPPKAHHIWKDYTLIPEIEVDGETYYSAHCNNDDILSIFSTYKDNIKNLNPATIKKFESYKESNPHHYYTDIMGLVSSGVSGRIFKRYNLYDTLPQDEFYTLYGLDFGYSIDPSAFVELNINKKQRVLYVKLHFYEPGLTTNQIYQRIKSVISGNNEIIADSAERRIIDELLFNGLMVIPCIKGTDSIRAGINQMQEYTIYLHKDSKELIEEFNNYSWAKNVDKDLTQKPIDKWNHAIDATRYALNYYHTYYM